MTTGALGAQLWHDIAGQIGELQQGVLMSRALRMTQRFRIDENAMDVSCDMANRRKQLGPT